MEALDSDPHSYYLLLNTIFLLLTPQIWIPSGGLILLIICSGLVSGSEVAFFSIRGRQLFSLNDSEHAYHHVIVTLLKKPRLLLATILIANNIINIAIIILFTNLSNHIFDFSANPVVAFLVDVVAITFILVLLGEVIPKVYANQLNIGFASFMAYPMLFCSRFLYPVSIFLVRFTNIIENKLTRSGSDISIEDLKEAIDITATEESTQEEKKILKGIVNFGNITVKQIMTTRMDVVAYDINSSLRELVDQVNEHRYSRIPIFEESFDHVRGILYIKDLIPHLEQASVKWQDLIREAYYVPENKKIDDLLREFQEKKVHMAIVVDEYGGSSGIITMEDILEEIVGEINDEFDDDEIYYSKLDDKNYVFDGKTSLTDFKRVLNLEDFALDDYKGEVESLGGLMVEVTGKIPRPGETLELENMLFTIESSDKRRVRRVKVTFTEQREGEEES